MAELPPDATKFAAPSLGKKTGFCRRRSAIGKSRMQIRIPAAN
jgi:hypothetical protein